MKLLVGLGNPGEKYRQTRHNLGWLALDHCIRAFGLQSVGDRFQGRFGDGRIGSNRVYFLYPETYMNRAGSSVASAARFFKLQPDQIVVFHDDLDLDVGRIRMKCGGGNGGHNGLKSIQELVGSAAFVRIRLGIGRPPPRMDVANFVLAPFSSEEHTLIDPLLDRLSQVLPSILDGDLPDAMNRLFNAPANKTPTP